jgi:hypothetical protein
MIKCPIPGLIGISLHEPYQYFFLKKDYLLLFIPSRAVVIFSGS